MMPSMETVTGVEWKDVSTKERPMMQMRLRADTDKRRRSYPVGRVAHVRVGIRPNGQPEEVWMPLGAIRYYAGPECPESGSDVEQLMRDVASLVEARMGTKE